MTRRKTKPRTSTLQRRIRQLRTGLGLTQAQVATACGLTDKSTVAQWERGVNSPRSHVLPRLAAVLNVTVDDLYADGRGPSMRPAA